MVANANDKWESFTKCAFKLLLFVLLIIKFKTTDSCQTQQNARPKHSSDQLIVIW